MCTSRIMKKKNEVKMVNKPMSKGRLNKKKTPDHAFIPFQESTNILVCCTVAAAASAAAIRPTTHMLVRLFMK